MEKQGRPLVCLIMAVFIETNNFEEDSVLIEHFGQLHTFPFLFHRCQRGQCNKGESIFFLSFVTVLMYVFTKVR